MSKLPNLIDCFPNSDQISTSDMVSFLQNSCDPKLLENELGNRLLYPHTISTTEKDLQFDLAILYAAIKANVNVFYKRSSQNELNSKIIIPENLLSRFPNLLMIIWVYINTLNPFGIISLYLQTEIGTKNLGTIIRPQILKYQGQAVVELGQEGAAARKQKYQIKVGSAVVIPTTSTRVDINFSCQSAKIEDKSDLTAHVIGGEAGIIVDLRKSKQTW